MTNRALTLTITEARELLERIASMYGVSADEIRGRRRWQPLPEARAVFALVMRDRGYSYPEIGYALFVHHTSIMAMCRNPLPRALYVAEGIKRDQYLSREPAIAPAAQEGPRNIVVQHDGDGMFREGEAA